MKIRETDRLTQPTSLLPPADQSSPLSGDHTGDVFPSFALSTERRSRLDTIQSPTSPATSVGRVPHNPELWHLRCLFHSVFIWVGLHGQPWRNVKNHPSRSRSQNEVWDAGEGWPSKTWHTQSGVYMIWAMSPPPIQDNKQLGHSWEKTRRSRKALDGDFKV